MSTATEVERQSEASSGSGAQCYTFDITVWHDQCDDRFKLVKVLKEYCKKFAFQLEKGEENGTLHWQCRVSLHKKKRKWELINQWPIPKCHIEYTCKTVHQGQNFNYCMKADTRVEGPWTDKDEDEPPFLSNAVRRYMTYQKYPWQEALQQKIEHLIEIQDDRTIICVIDQVGNSGKSVFCKFLHYKQIAFCLPTLLAMEDILQFCMSNKPQKCYLIDMPRALKKEKLNQFWSGIEQLKNGYLYDKRYKGQIKMIDEPQVVVFSNFPPDIRALSIDRWKLYQLTESRDIIPYTVPCMIDT